MAEQDSNNEIIVQLPWIVPQQGNTQAVVLQQPNGQKVYLDLNHSTDTTAIWSFIVAMVIAIALGGLATFLAYWYGKRSFDLTKQSFDVTIAQIKSAENLMMESNLTLVKSQYSQSITDHKIQTYNITKSEFKKLLVEFLTLAENFATYIGFTAMESKDISLSFKAQSGSYAYEVFKQTQSMLKNMQTIKVKISFEIFYLVEELQSDVNENLKDIVMKAALLNNDLISKNESIQTEIAAYRKHIEKFKTIAKYILDKEITLEKFLD
jgi:hypothetical protein